MLFVAMVTAEINPAQSPSPSLPSLPVFCSQVAHHMVLQVTSEGLICNLLNVCHPCVCVCLIKGNIYHCRPGRPMPVTVWLKGNTVFGTIWSISCWAQDYLLDNHLKEDW